VLLKKLKILAAEQEKRHNDLLKEAIVDILKKYGKKGSQKVYLNFQA
jgi:PII-like signaling protein